MGIYVNPGNSGFAQICRGKYIDKTNLIERINQRISGPGNLICISRPRRFGKSYAARMLTAYYDCSCDSHKLFDDKKIAVEEDYERHLNQYNVIYLEITSFISRARQEGVPLGEIPVMVKKAVWKDLEEAGFEHMDRDTLCDYLIHCVEQSGGKKFIFIIDEWDAVIREAKDDLPAQRRFLDLLREWDDERDDTQ